MFHEKTRSRKINKRLVFIVKIYYTFRKLIEYNIFFKRRLHRLGFTKYLLFKVTFIKKQMGNMVL